MRSGLLAKFLAERGHQVTWWSTTFDHARKEYRYPGPVEYHWRDGVTIRHLHSKTPYKKNISWARIVNHREIKDAFRETIRNLEEPDLILAGMPTPEVCVEVVRFGKQKNIPTLLDIRDLWPDDMVRLAPSLLQWAARWVLRPIQRDVTEACQKATGICATSPIFVDWGLNHAKRSRSLQDADFPLGYSDQKPKVEDQTKAEVFWRKYGITREGDDFILCFFGALGATCLLRPVMDAVRSVRSNGLNVKLVICGKGDRYNEYKTYAKGDESILMTGWVGRPEIWSLMQLADVGLVPVQNIFSYMSNYPNKTIEYMSSGLPILSSLKGMFGELVENEQIGLIYGEKDVDDLSKKICRLMDHPDERSQMASNARQLYEQRFAAEKVYSAFSEHLENIVKGKTCQ